MASYVGETVAVTSTAVDPVTSESMTNLLGEVEFYAPGKNPKTVVTDRVADHTVAATWDPERQLYVAYADTTGWPAGRWSYKFRLFGDKNSWEYGSLTLKA